ncbi:MAG: purine-binding chemotaxis protein CheW [Deltaproteobacteria bacterium]|nr:purine-binding chemotaxis protein CheW [Deltaproteobacteria bacterium]
MGSEKEEVSKALQEAKEEAREGSSESAGVVGGKFLSFLLHNEEYGLDVLSVREIIGIIDITTVPQMPNYVKGVVNLRGKVIPVIDLRLRFGIPEISYDEETCIIVVEVGDMLMGIIIDTVLEVLDITAKDIEPPPSFGTKVKTDFILGMGKIGKKVKILLDIDKVLTSEELAMVEKMQKA